MDAENETKETRPRAASRGRAPSETTMSQVLEITAETFEEFCQKAKALFAALEDPAADRDMLVEFPPEEFPIMPIHAESSQTMTSINGRVIELATAVMQAAKSRVLREKGPAIDRVKQFIIYPAGIKEGTTFLLRLTKKAK